MSHELRWTGATFHRGIFCLMHDLTTWLYDNCQKYFHAVNYRFLYDFFTWFPNLGWYLKGEGISSHLPTPDHLLPDHHPWSICFHNINHVQKKPVLKTLPSGPPGCQLHLTHVVLMFTSQVLDEERQLTCLLMFPADKKDLISDTAAICLAYHYSPQMLTCLTMIFLTGKSLQYEITVYY